MSEASARPDRHKLGIIALLGMVSGLPLLLTGSTMTTRMRVEGVDVATIGFFAWAHLPYTFKFVWAPLLDRFQLPLLGRRRGWILAFQLSLVVGIALLGLLDAKGNFNLLFTGAVIVALLSASLDIVVDAYRTDVLEEKERGPGGALYVTGYRAALVIAGAGVLVASDFMPWSLAYLLLAGIMLLSIVVTFLARPAEEVEGRPTSFREAAFHPFLELRARKAAFGVLIFLLLYKLGEGIAGHLIHPFLIDVGFSPSAVGAINKGIGLPASVAGTILGGIAVSKIGVRISLIVFGLLQAAPNLLYGVLHQVGADHGMLALVVSVDQFCNGLATAALVVYLMSLCDRRYTAFQYAFLVSATSVLGRFVSGWSGVVQEHIGWPWFFAVTAISSLPAIVLLMLLAPGSAMPEPPKSAST